MKYILLLLFISCGGQEHSLSIDDSTQSIDGEAYTYIVVKFDFITNINQLCKDLNPKQDFIDDIERNKVIAQCTFDNLTILDTSMVSDFQNSYCDQDDVYNNLPQEEKDKIDQLCEIL